MKILMLDDDSRYLELMKTMLEGDSHDVITSVDGNELRRLFDLYQPNIVVLDVLMGEKNGIELAHRLRQDTGNNDVPILFVSAWTGAKYFQLPKNSSRLFKPFVYSDLVHAIDKAIRLNMATAKHNEHFSRD